MAYLDLEFRNAKLVWETWGDRVMAIGLIGASLMVATLIANMLMPGTLELMP
jgi:ABC-type cobalamin transport system permease subunit